MRKVVWGLLMAAGALLPGLASAQDADANRGGWRERAARAPRADVREGDRPQRWGGGNWQRPNSGEGGRGGNWQRPAPQAQPAFQPAAPQSPAPQPQAGGRDWSRGDRAQGQDRGDRPRWANRGDGTPGQGWQWRGDGQNGRPAWQSNRDAQNGRPDWRGNGNDQPGRDWQRRDGNRADGRFDGNRADGRFDGRRDDNRWNWQRNNRPSTGWQRDRADWNDQYRGDRGFGDRSAWNRGWRNDNRYDWNRYRLGNRGAYHLPRYYAPYGWGYGYRRFSIGVTLSNLLFAQDYWIDEPWDYRLPPAYGPYRWVRYYNDALLVDVRYGQVVDVVYDIFW